MDSQNSDTEQALERLRAIPLESVLQNAGAVRDPNNTERWVTPQAGVFVIRGKQFFNTERRKSGHGAIALVSCLQDCDFRQAVATLKSQQSAPRLPNRMGFRSELAAANLARRRPRARQAPAMPIAQELAPPSLEPASTTAGVSAGEAIQTIEPTSTPVIGLSLEDLFAAPIDDALLLSLETPEPSSRALDISSQQHSTKLPTASSSEQGDAPTPVQSLAEQKDDGPTFADTLAAMHSAGADGNLKESVTGLRDELAPLPDAPAKALAAIDAAESNHRVNSTDLTPGLESPPPAAPFPDEAEMVHISGGGRALEGGQELAAGSAASALAPLRLPARGSEQAHRDVARYLVSGCRFNVYLVTNLLRRGVLYADVDGNAVFLMRKPDGTVIGAEIKSTTDAQGVLALDTRTRLAPGTQTHLGTFFIAPDSSSRVVLTNTAFEALAYSSMTPKDTVISMAGCVNTRLMEWLGPRLMRSGKPLFAAMPDTDDGRFGAELLRTTYQAKPHFPTDRVKLDEPLRQHATTWRSLLYWADEAARHRRARAQQAPVTKPEVPAPQMA